MTFWLGGELLPGLASYQHSFHYPSVLKAAGPSSLFYYTYLIFLFFFSFPFCLVPNNSVWDYDTQIKYQCLMTETIGNLWDMPPPTPHTDLLLPSTWVCMDKGCLRVGTSRGADFQSLIGKSVINTPQDEISHPSDPRGTRVV